MVAKEEMKRRAEINYRNVVFADLEWYWKHGQYPQRIALHKVRRMSLVTGRGIDFTHLCVNTLNPRCRKSHYCPMRSN